MFDPYQGLFLSRFSHIACGVIHVEPSQDPVKFSSIFYPNHEVVKYE